MRVCAVVNPGKFTIIDGIRFDEGAMIKNLSRAKAEKRANQGVLTIVTPSGKPKKK